MQFFSPVLSFYCRETWPCWLANSSGLEHSTEYLFISWLISVQLSHLSSIFFFFCSASCKIWRIFSFSPLAWVLHYECTILILQQQRYTRNSWVFPAFTETPGILVLQYFASPKGDGEAAINSSGCCAVESFWYTSLFSFPVECYTEGGDIQFFCIFLFVIF